MDWTRTQSNQVDGNLTDLGKDPHLEKFGYILGLMMKTNEIRDITLQRWQRVQGFERWIIRTRNTGASAKTVPFNEKSCD